MLVQKQTIIFSETETMYWENWVWSSHKWVEQKKGNYTCQFCNATFKNDMIVISNFKLCPDNPIIKERSI